MPEFTYIIVVNPPNNLTKYCYLHCPDEETKKLVKRLDSILITSNGGRTRTWVLYDPKACLNYLISLLPLDEKIHIRVYKEDAVSRIFVVVVGFFLAEKQRTLKIVSFTIIEYNTIFLI